MKYNKNLTVDDLLLAIAQDCFFGIETLEERKRDSLDFHTVSVWAIKRALRAAYVAGQNSVSSGSGLADGD